MTCFLIPVPAQFSSMPGEASAPRRRFHACMFAPHMRLPDDRATGDDVAAFAGQIADADRPGDGDHTLIVEQGFEMGRPSLITLGLDIDGGALVAASIGGEVVLVADGTLH